MHSTVLPKLALILSTSLAQTENITLTDCKLDPCSGLDAMVDEGHVLAPIVVAGVAWAVGSLPVFVLGSRHRVACIRSCLWVLLLLWMTLLTGSALFYTSRIQAYVWVIHAVCGVLYSWNAKLFRYPGLQRLTVSLGVWCVSWYAWQYVPPLGITGWFSGGQAQCGGSIHLKACLGIDLALWVLMPVRRLVEGVDS